MACRRLIYFLFVFFCAASSTAEIRCIEEETNKIIVGIKPFQLLVTESPQICATLCLSAKNSSCSMTYFKKKSTAKSGTCFLYSSQAGLLIKQHLISADNGSALLHSVSMVLPSCPDISKNNNNNNNSNNNTNKFNMFQKVANGRRIVNVKGKSDWALPISMTIDAWGPWTEWSPCFEQPSVQQLHLYRNRVSVCSFCGSSKIIKYEIGNCNSLVWSEWQAWSPCSSSCGEGFSVRRRICPVQNACAGLAEEVTYCKTLPCATWTEWSAWSSCVGTCDTGYQYRIRKCVGLGICPGLEQEHRLCNNLPPCCQQWSQWSSCSVSCGRGVRTRVRTCKPKNDFSNPPHLKEISLCEFPQCTKWDPCIVWINHYEYKIHPTCMIEHSITSY